MKISAKRVEKWLQAQLPLLLALLLLLVLRLPNFFEPYWYGDEGIYLTIGQAIRDGEKLYTDIVDHKTPIIYYLASVPNQFCFRVLNLGWMIITTIAFYQLAKKIFQTKVGLYLSTLIFIILTTVPWFEGNIPNGELFVMGFILIGGWIFFTTSLSALFFNQRKSLKSLDNPLKLLLIGSLFGLAVLTKVPGVFDVAGFLSIIWLIMTNRWDWLCSSTQQSRHWWRLLLTVIKHLLLILVGFTLPILISIIYFTIQGSGQDYLQFGLLYNFQYTASWGMPYQQAWLNFFFTLPGKISLLTFVFALITLLRKKLKPAVQFAASWSILALVASSLSNRPYPHYFLQLIPPLILLIGLIGEELVKHKKNKPKINASFWSNLIIGLLIILLSLGFFGSLGFPTYGTFDYYQKFYRLMTGKISRVEYRQSFSHFMDDNYEAAEIIKNSGVDEIFIWGTNPMLYALSQTQPTGRFTVSFHIKDLNYYPQTMASIREKAPLFIVVMKDENQELMGLSTYLETYYLPNKNFKNFILWKRFN